MRDNHAVIAVDHTCQYILRQVDILQRHIGKRRLPVHLRLEKPDPAARKILHVESRRCHQDTRNLACGNELRVQHQVYIEILLQIVLRLAHELHIAYPRHGMCNIMLLGKDTGDHIHLIARRHCHEHIRALHSRIVHRDRARSICHHCQHIKRILHGLQTCRVAIDHDDIHLLLRQQLGNAVPQLSHSNNHDVHSMTPFLLRFIVHLFHIKVKNLESPLYPAQKK